MLDYNGIFGAVSRAFNAIRSINGVQNASIPTWIRSVAASYGTPPSVAANAGLALSGFEQASDRLNQTLATQAKDGFIAAIDAAITLSSPSIQPALAALIVSMYNDAQTVRKSTVTLNWVPRNNANGIVAMAGTVNAPNGNPFENCFGETISLTYQSPVSLKVTSPRAITDTLDPMYPAGSGLNTATPIYYADASPGTRTGQMLSNGELDGFSGGYPASWRALAGQTSRNISESDIDYSGYGAMTITGDGTELTGIQQIFGGDTPTKLPPSTNVGICMFVRLDSIPSTGILEVKLVNSSGGTLSSAFGFCSKQFNLKKGLGLWGYGRWGDGTWARGDGGGAWGTRPWGAVPWGTGIGSPYVPLTACFTTPSSVPTGSSIVIRLAEALPAGTKLQIDRVAMAPAKPLYVGGPSIVLFAGQTVTGSNYEASLFVDNDWAGLTQWAFNVLFGTRELGIQMPSSLTPTVGDTVALGALPAARPGGAGVGAGSAGGSSSGGYLPQSPSPPIGGGGGYSGMTTPP